MMAITPLPTPPSRADSASFAARADAFLAALQPFAVELGATAADVTAKQQTASTAATTATTKAGEAGTSATSAFDSAGVATQAAADAGAAAAAALGYKNAAGVSAASASDSEVAAAASAASVDPQNLSTDHYDPTEPAITWPGMTWGDSGSTPKMLRRRNAANSAWIAEGELFQYKANRNGDATQNFNVASLNGGQIAGMRNKIINGNFAVNQRAVSGTVSLAAGAYGHDRFKAGGAGCTYAFATAANITTLNITAGTLMQVIEGINLQSGTHVLSYAGTAPARIDGGAWGVSGIQGVSVGGTNQTVEFGVGTLSLVQYEPGAIATPFEFRPVTVEEMLCARYLPAWVIAGAGNTSVAAGGVCYSTTAAEFNLPYRVTPRVVPTGITATANAFAALTAGGVVSAASTVTFGGSSNGPTGLSVLLAGTNGLVAGNATILYKVGSGTARILATGCEL